MNEIISPLVDIKNLEVKFTVNETDVTVLKDISFSIPPGKTVALVGESGSGKSVTAQAILGILPSNGRVSAGQINYVKNRQVIDIAQLNPRSKEMQDP